MVGLFWSDEPVPPDRNSRKRKLALDMHVGPP